MKLRFAILLLITFFLNAEAQSIFSENMGTPSGATPIATNVFQNAGVLTYSNGGQPGSAEVRTTNASGSYSGASAGGNIFFSSTISTCGFSIEGINASSYSSLTLKFGYRKESLSSHASFAVEYWNGATWTNLANTSSTLFYESATATTGWYASKNLLLPADAQIGNLKLRFIKTGSGSIRIDDVVLSGTEILPTVLNDVVSAIGTSSATFAGNVTATGGASITATGAVFSKTSVNAAPALGGTQVTTINTPSPNSGTGTFSNSTGTILLPNVQYSYNAYATKSTGATGYGTASTFYTLADTPAAPSAGSPSATTVDLAVGSDANSLFTLYAFLETSTGNYVQSDGSLGSAAVYQSAAAWGTKVITGLTPLTSYTFRAIARNGDGIDTIAGASTNITTLAMPAIDTSGTLSALSTTYGSASSFTSFVFSAANLTGNILISAPVGFEISITPNGADGYAATQIVSPTSGSVSTTTVYVRLATTTPFGTYGGNVVLASANDNVNVVVYMVSSSVLKQTITISGISIMDKQYDGNTNATISGYPVITGIIASDEGLITFQPDEATANFIDAAIGSGKAVVVTGYAISGAPADNYELVQPAGLTADITSNSGGDLS